jgi:hypothetical protein
MGENNYGEERVNFDEEHAEDMVQKGLWRLGWRESDLEAKPKGDPEKLKLAVRLRAETTVTVKWIAQRLRMGTWTYLDSLLYRQRRGK